jgi:ribosomal protein S15P/S13E
VIDELVFQATMGHEDISNSRVRQEITRELHRRAAERDPPIPEDVTLLMYPEEIEQLRDHLETWTEDQRRTWHQRLQETEL